MKNININININWRWIFFVAASVPSSLIHAQVLDIANDDGLSMYDAIDMAKVNDPWITGSLFKQAKLNAMGVAAANYLILLPVVYFLWRTHTINKHQVLTEEKI